MKKFQRQLTSLMLIMLVVGNIGWVISHLERNEKAKSTPTDHIFMQDPRPIGLGHGVRKKFN